MCIRDSHSPVHKTELDVFALELAKALGNSLQRPAHVSFEDQIEGGSLSALNLFEEVLELGAAQCRTSGWDMARHPVTVGACLANGTGLGLLGSHPEVVTRFRWFGETQDLHLSLIHISEPTRLGMISYAVFCLKKK